jgi:hypothetical protein
VIEVEMSEYDVSNRVGIESPCRGWGVVNAVNLSLFVVPLFAHAHIDKKATVSIGNQK